MRKYDVLVMGELNVDLILNKIQTFPELGKEIIAREMTLTLGSSSAIFACNAASLGSSVAFLGKLGNDYFGNLVVDSLVSKNVNTDFIIRSSDYVTGATINLSFDEERAQITHPGAMEFLGKQSLTSAILANAAHLHISSVFLQPLVKRDIVKIFKMAKEAGLTTSLDTQWDPSEAWDLDLPSLLPFVDVFMPNQDEILALTKSSSAEEGISKLKEFANTIVVKMGRRGSMAWQKGVIYRAEPFLNQQVVDAIGAGDSFASGFVSHFIKGHDIQRCLKFGNLTGAINTTAAGGTAAFSSHEKIKETALQRFGVKLKEM